MEKEILVKLMSELGFPILIAMISIYLFFLTLKYILKEVKTLIDKILIVIDQIDSKIKHIDILLEELDIVMFQKDEVMKISRLDDLSSKTYAEIIRKQRNYDVY